ncbi:MAG TPA: gamma-glutamyl-gamma-aminobutyrate hydrolase family protein [Candidatus Peribacteria bacterium]|nr:gamma-glutamyl-gamma-aminobutyrate hydrolase family protein [Candidatus Peribacteria bacterium]
MATPKKKILVSVAKNSHSEKRRHALVCGNYVDWLEGGLKHYEIWAVDPSDKKKVLRAVDDIAGIVFTGGVNIDPKMYGEERNSHTGNPNVPRDQFESMLFDLFQPKKLPILGLCRGAQFVNIKFGGKLKQNVNESHRRLETGKDAMHKVDLKKDTRFAELFKSPSIETNSAHQQAVDPKNVGKGLRVTGTVKEVVESLENIDGKTGYIQLVQWHPERMKSSPVSKKLLADFEQAVDAFLQPAAAKAPAKEKPKAAAKAKPAAKGKKAAKK